MRKWESGCAGRAVVTGTSAFGMRPAGCYRKMKCGIEASVGIWYTKERQTPEGKGCEADVEKCEKVRR